MDESAKAKQEALDLRYMRMASIWAENSYCKRRQVGALIVKDKMIISDGYNGTPSGFENVCEDENNVTKPYVLHAEANAITKIARSNNSSEGATLYVTASPCIECAKLIIQAGIKRVVYSERYRLEDGIDLLRKAGIERVEGRLVGDPRFFDTTTPENLGWSYDDLGTSYGVGPTGLNFFENAQNFLITPGSAPGAEPNVSPRYPETPWMRYSVSAVTGGRGSANTVYYVNTPLAPLGDFGGSFPVDRRGYTYEGSNRFGAYTCAWYFLNYLAENDFEVSGGCADISSEGNLRLEPGFGDTGEAAAAPGALNIIGGTSSANLAAIVAETNHESNNFYAETLLKMTGLTGGYSCSGDAAIDAEEELFEVLGAPAGGRCKLVDGSGLSRKNYVSAGFFVDFLRCMMREPFFETYLRSLPSPGSRGTLEYKFPRESDEFRARIYMKSGSMNGILCYSGYILPSAPGGETIVFSLLTNNVTASSWSLSPLIDRIIGALAAEN